MADSSAPAAASPDLGISSKTQRLPRHGMSTAQRSLLKKALSERKLTAEDAGDGGAAGGGRRHSSSGGAGGGGGGGGVIPAEEETPGRPDEEHFDKALQQGGEDLEAGDALLAQPNPKRSASIKKADGTVLAPGDAIHWDSDDEEGEEEEEEEEEEVDEEDAKKRKRVRMSHKKNEESVLPKPEELEDGDEYEGARKAAHKPYKTRGSINNTLAVLAMLPKSSPAAAAPKVPVSVPESTGGGSEADAASESDASAAAAPAEAATRAQQAQERKRDEPAPREAEMKATRSATGGGGGCCAVQ